MKKKFLFFLLLISLGICAKPYEHSFGLSAGMFNGVSHKILIKENLAMQTDLGVHLSVCVGELLGTFEINPNVMYQKVITSKPLYDLNFFVGGGTSFGFMTFTVKYYEYDKTFGGKWGVNTILGLEVALSRLPMSFSLDFRPGYGLFWGDWYDGGRYNGGYYGEWVYLVDSFFDWGINLGMRFYF